eukprot:TRINITY_DN47069_c0_g1_i1.p1 TRINITY_DN47069_c0_g1~~TRINITY_DN47069_c0_g1_i1.p1  ORF type:complete len:156 (+),score=12.66 TRINITY_DN47069_c0_g1_i1:23-469(+)
MADRPGTPTGGDTKVLQELQKNKTRALRFTKKAKIDLDHMRAHIELPSSKEELIEVAKKVRALKQQVDQVEGLLTFTLKPLSQAKLDEHALESTDSETEKLTKITQISLLKMNHLIDCINTKIETASATEIENLLKWLNNFNQFASGR